MPSGTPRCTASHQTRLHMRPRFAQPCDLSPPALSALSALPARPAGAAAAGGRRLGRARRPQRQGRQRHVPARDLPGERGPAAGGGDGAALRRDGAREGAAGARAGSGRARPRPAAHRPRPSAQGPHTACSARVGTVLRGGGLAHPAPARCPSVYQPLLLACRPATPSPTPSGRCSTARTPTSPTPSQR